MDVTEVGSPNYFAHPSTEPAMLGWAIDDREVQLWEPDIQPVPALLLAALKDPTVLKLAWRADFERRGVFRFLETDSPVEEWFDIMVLARYCSFPGKLIEACRAMGLPPEFTKMAEEGDDMIRTFSMPKRLGGRQTLFGIEPTFFNTRQNKPAEWEIFKTYCKQDVKVERHIRRALQKFMLPEKEKKLWFLDQTINYRGMPVHMKIVENALKMALESRENLLKMLKELTGLENPNSDTQMLEWLGTQGYTATSMNKKVVDVMLAKDTLTPLGREVLLIRKEFKRSSYTKLETILKHVSPDGRLRDLFAFMGASRTGRWSGQDVQFQNLARPDKKVEENLARALALLESGDMATAIEEFSPEITVTGLKKKLPTVLGMVVSCLRSIFQAKRGYILLVSDLSSIENRVLGWLAGCDAILEVFRQKKDSYKAFAVLMYQVAYELVTKEMRQVAKPAVLGCGYGLGPGVIYHADTDTYEIIWHCDHCQKNVELGHQCHDEKGIPVGNLMKTGLLGYAEAMYVKLTPEQAYKSWLTFREAFPEVPDLWYAVEKAAIKAIEEGGHVKPVVRKSVDGEWTHREIPFVEFSRVKRRNGQFILRCLLPSGRYLHYVNARVETTTEISRRSGKEYEKKSIFYDGIGHGVGALTKQIKWGPVYTYGGKLVENIVQAISRDILTEGMLLAEEMGISLVGHVHDELIAEVREMFGRPTVKDLIWCMAHPIEWAPGLPLDADGYEGQVYRKG